MTRRLPVIVAVLAVSVCSAAADAPRPAAPADTAVTFYDSLYANDLPPETFAAVAPGYVPFGAGEKLVYSVQYGLVTAGEATLEVRNLAAIQGRTCYRIVSDARTNEFFSKFFEVRDRYESYMDTTNLYSLRYEKHVREGKFKRDDVDAWVRVGGAASSSDELGVKDGKDG